MYLRMYRCVKGYVCIYIYIYIYYVGGYVCVEAYVYMCIWVYV